MQVETNTSIRTRAYCREGHTLLFLILYIKVDQFLDLERGTLDCTYSIIQRNVERIVSLKDRGELNRQVSIGVI